MTMNIHTGGMMYFAILHALEGGCGDGEGGCGEGIVPVGRGVTCVGLE